MTAREASAPDPLDTLSALDEEERNGRFRRLQERMPSVWDAMRHDSDDESVSDKRRARAAPGTLSSHLFTNVQPDRACHRGGRSLTREDEVVTLAAVRSADIFVLSSDASEP